MRLHKQVERQNKRVESFVQGINDFRRHLRSSKFHQDTTIQVSDVHNYLDNIIATDTEIEMLFK